MTTPGINTSIAAVTDALSATSLPLPQSKVGFSTTAKGLLQPEVALYFASPDEARTRGPQLLQEIYQALLDAGLPIAQPGGAS